MRLIRLLRISQVMVKHGLDDFIVTLHLFRPYRFLLRLMPWRWRPRIQRPRGRRIREALEELGPIFVKFGQMLSSRPDLLPEDIASELGRLQDRVTPFPGETARAVIEQSYGEPLSEHFADFDAEPVASASVAQVHVAHLFDGTEVVIKVLRPGINEVIERDLDLLYTLARLAHRYWDQGPRLRPIEVVEEYDKTIHDELDLSREAASATKLKANFADSDIIYIPAVYWEHTRRDVMVMERIDGIPIREIDQLKAAGIDMRKLAHDGVEIFFTQAFRDGFFHADMHPGNIFVSEEGQYRAVDFGIMGTLGDEDKRYLAENFLAFFRRDYRAVAEAHLRAGWVPPHTRVQEFEAAIRTVCEPIFAKPISEISFGRLVMTLFQTARRFDMPVQPQLVLLQKTLLNIEGLGRRLYPELDLWETAKPYLERWMSEQAGHRAFLEGLKRELPQLGKILPDMPRLVHAYLEHAAHDANTRKHEIEVLQKLHRDVNRNQRRQYFAGIGSILLLGALIVSGLDGYAPIMVANVPLLSWFVGGIGAALLVWSWPR
ncbi:MAG: putative protein kinase UbiB [Gammaproteobacteria bacterium]|nr:putative protein kinase UbiB [Gammaproteobacteria bacterium]